MESLNTIMMENKIDEDRTEPFLGNDESLGVIGLGVMGRALIEGILRSTRLPRDRVWGATRHSGSNPALSDKLGIKVVVDYAALLPTTKVILLCVKPAQIAGAISRLRQSGLRADTVLVSIAAGLSTMQLEKLSATVNPWVRAMPNTPCVVGESMTVLCGGQHATAEHLRCIQSLFGAVGRCRVVEESHFNAITALSGSGPAYVYLIIEALADAGVKVGLSRPLATELVAQTVVGAAKMVQASGRHPAALRDDVTTPAGCTIGGLLMLEDGKIRSVLARAVEEATRIAQNLGKDKKVEA